MSSTPWSCSGDAKALCKATCHALAAIQDLHITQRPCTKKTLMREAPSTLPVPQPELQNPHPWVLSAKGQRLQIYPVNPAAG